MVPRRAGRARNCLSRPRAVKRSMPRRKRLSKAHGGTALTALTALLAKAQCGVIQLDSSGRIVAANFRARVLLRTRQVIYEKSGYLSAVRRSDNHALQALLARALPDEGDEEHAARRGSITVSRPRAHPCQFLHVIPLTGQDEGDTNDVAAFVLVVDLPRWARIDANLISGALGLSPAEARVAVMLAKGHKLREIAVLTGPNYGTLRWHLQNIFAKCGVSNQMDLVHLVLSVSADGGAQR